MNWKDKCVSEIKARRDIVVAQIEQGNAELRQIDDTLRALGADGGVAPLTRARTPYRARHLLATLREAHPNGVTNVQLMAGAAPADRKKIGQSLQGLRKRNRARSESDKFLARRTVQTWFYVPPADSKETP